MQIWFVIQAHCTVWPLLALQLLIIAPWAPGKGALKLLPSVGSLHHEASPPAGPWSKPLLSFTACELLLTPQVSAPTSPPQGSFPRFSSLDQVPDNSLCKQAEPLLHSTYHYSNYTHTSVFPSRLWAPGGRNGFCFAHHCQVQSRSSHTGAERAEEVTKLGLPPLKRGPCHQARRW